MNQVSLSSPLGALKGIGKTKEALLARAGLSTVAELLCYLPSDWIDGRLTPLAQADDSAIHCFELEVLSYPSGSYRKGGKHLVRLEAGDDTGRVTVCFLNQPYAAGQYQKGQRVIFMGRLSFYQGKGYLFNPKLLKNAPETPLLAVYPKPKGLNDTTWRAAVAQVLPLCQDLPETLPDQLMQKHGLLTRAQTLQALHAPQSPRLLEEAQRRLSYQRLLSLACRMNAWEHKRAQHQSPGLHPVDPQGFWQRLSFAPTACQRRAVEQIAGDLVADGPRPVMNRLLQGDVGSGKTAVAAAACHLVTQNGLNCVIMAPTEILAQQHYAFFSQVFDQHGVQVVLLTGASTTPQRRAFAQAFQQEKPVIAIGTHALLEPGVALERVALAITDEQQRFGVLQREQLLEKCLYPNSLVMSATPIPRSLALFMFRQDHISVLDQLPPGRKPVETYLIGPDKAARLLGFLKERLSAGDQAYVVCPMIDTQEEDPQLKSAQSVCRQLAEDLPQWQVACLHGKMKNAQKQEIMDGFARGQIQVLVSTTVIEVGVNVPNANLMIVENAERFGLAQLHQLRGRVGRGHRQAYCVLTTPKTNAPALRRLKLLTQTQNGFDIAAYDLEARGHGDFFGVAQSGRVVLPPTDPDQLEKAKADALWLEENHPRIYRELLGTDFELSCN